MDACAGINTLEGTLTALLLLVTITLTPPEGAAELNNTEQEVVPAPVNALSPQEKELMEGAAEDALLDMSEIDTDLAMLP